MFNTIPTQFSPSILVAIDDNQWFLDILSTFLSDIRKAVSFISPNDAFSYLTQHHKKYTIPSETPKLPDFSSSKRFKKNISTIICDYDMPVENGLDFLKRAYGLNTSYQKILLTGMISKQTGYKALEQKHINHLLLKDDLMENVYQLKKLVNSCEIVFQENTNTSDHASSILNHLPYIQLINNAIEQYQAVEGYLLDNNGDYLLIDKTGKPYILETRNSLTKPNIIEADANYCMTTSKLHDIYSFENYLLNE